jgi:glycerol-3-phosphate dehydrogenase (NAD(P)+)
MMRQFGPFLEPSHIVIHGTKGFDISGVDEQLLQERTITRDNVHTMSEVILQESVVRRVGCLSGPNLAGEILEGQPTATLIGSKYREVIKLGKQVLKSNLFQVFGSYDILGAELAGALKNSIAIGSGILFGLGMGKNIQAMLITRGLVEMVYFGKAMGADGKAFIGTAGIGDLVATATSEQSRNFTFGRRLAQGESLEHINSTMPELAEGVRTIRIMRRLARYYRLRVPITEMLYQVVFEGHPPIDAIEYLINYPYDVDVDFL